MGPGREEMDVPAARIMIMSHMLPATARRSELSNFVIVHQMLSTAALVVKLRGQHVKNALCTRLQTKLYLLFLQLITYNNTAVFARKAPLLFSHLSLQLAAFSKQ